MFRRPPSSTRTGTRLPYRTRCRSAFRRAGDRGNLRIRISAYAAGIGNMLTVAGSEPTPWLYDDHLRMVGVKFYLDGALGSRGAWLKAPYADAPGESGLPLMTGAQDRKSVVSGKSVSVLVDLGGRRTITKKYQKSLITQQ